MSDTFLIIAYDPDTHQTYADDFKGETALAAVDIFKRQQLRFEATDGEYGISPSFHFIACLNSASALIYTAEDIPTT